MTGIPALFSGVRGAQADTVAAELSYRRLRASTKEEVRETPLLTSSPI